MADTQDDTMLGENVKVELTNPKLKTKLSEYGRRDKDTFPYNDNLECDALVVGGGFAGVFMFWLLKNQGLNVVMYEAGNGYGGKKPLAIIPIQRTASHMFIWPTEH